jgi:hypothetical protein
MGPLRSLLIGVVCHSVFAAASVQEGAPLAVLIDDVARVPVPILTKARWSVADVFRHAGIEIRWLECSFQEAEHHDPPGCQLPLDVPLVIAKILPQAEAQRWIVSDDALGFCVDNDAYLLLPRVLATADRQHLPVSLVLGYALAHEIGHGLLGAGHLAEGIMLGRLGKTEWMHAEKGQLLFTSKDARRLREQLLQRTRRKGG